VDGTGFPEKTKKPGHRPEERRNGVSEETKKQVLFSARQGA
jgi:hypothetical protein